MLARGGAIVPALLGCLIIGGTAFQTWQFEHTSIDLRAREDRLSRQFSALGTAVADLRSAQSGYVAAGQGANFWMNQFDDVAAQVGAVLAERQRAGHPDAVPHLAAAETRLETLRVSDRRARNYVANDQRLLASDVIFVESLEILGRLSAEITTAREAEIAAVRLEAATVRQYQLALAGGAMVLLFVLILVAGRRRAPQAAAEEATPGLITLRSPDQQAPDQQAKVQQPAAPQGQTRQSLDATADVCVDLARLLDGRDLPALLARTATAIGANGVVLWVIDEGRETLRPSLAHGYSERMVQRLGTLAVAADNVTSVACRTLQAQVIPASSADGSGAIAVPLIGTSGCVGVLAAEVAGAARDGSTLPLARVIAAQLAAVISPLPAEAAASHPPAAEAL